MDKKVCTKCKKEKNITEFNKNKRSKDNLQSYCRQCINEYRNTPKYREHRKNYYLKNLKRYKKYIKDNTDSNREKVMQHYGNKCICCGETEQVFLTIDHIKGGGRKHRKEIGGHIHRWLIKNNYPEGFQILCWNCNVAKHILGKCPHQNKGGKCE